MSIDATRWAWKQQDVTPSEKLVLLSLADRADEDHRCFPSIARLEHDTCLYRKTIMDAIKHLEHLGLLSVIRSSGAGNKYQLIGVENRHEPVSKSTPVVKSTPVCNSTHDQCGKPHRTSVENHTLIYQEPTSTKSFDLSPPAPKAKTGKTPFDFRGSLIEHGVPPEMADDYIAVRKAKKCVQTATAFKLLISESKKTGLPLSDVVEYCCKRGWGGFEASWIDTRSIRETADKDGGWI